MPAVSRQLLQVPSSTIELPGTCTSKSCHDICHDRDASDARRLAIVEQLAQFTQLLVSFTDMDDLDHDSLENLLQDVLRNPDGDPNVAAALAVAVPVDDSAMDPTTCEADATLVQRALANPSELTAIDAQELLRRRAQLVASGLVCEEAGVTVTLEGAGGGIHFLMHAKRNTTTPLFTVNGPNSGTLCPGNEAAYAGYGMLKISCAKKTDADGWTDAHYQVSVAVWREVLLSPALGLLKGENVRSPKQPEHYSDVQPKVSLVAFCPQKPSSASGKRPRQALPAGPSGGSASAEGEAQRPDGSFGKVEVDELRIKGVDVWQELMQQRDQMQRLQQMMAREDGDVGPGGSSQGDPMGQGRLPPASVPGLSSQRADLAEWMELLDHDEPVRCGDVGIVRGARFSRLGCVDEHQPGGVLFVVSSEPALAFNMPEEEARRVQGVVLAFLGRVPVYCIGDAPIDAPLVPSGLDDGSARAVSWAELDRTPELRALCFGVVWAHLASDSEERPMVLAFVSAHPLHSFGNLRNVAKVAPLQSALVPHPPTSPPITPRAYQAASIAEGLARNSIICLDTGLGKV